MIKMKKFEFSSNQTISKFKGDEFYEVYKNSDFLKNAVNITTILSKGYQLRQQLKAAAPGDVIVIDGMFLDKNIPLLVKKAGVGIKLEEYEFTNNRLTGLVAAYTFDNRKNFPEIVSSEASQLGLQWNHQDEFTCRLYLSAVTGTEHFYSQFSYWPLICALRKLHKSKLTLDLVVKITKIKNSKEETLAKVFSRNVMTVERLWTYFPGATPLELNMVINSLPQELKRLIVPK